MKRPQPVKPASPAPRPLPRSVRALPALLFVAGAAHAGANGAADDRKIESDMEFARALASRFAYVDMAESVIGSLEAEGLSGSNAEALELLKCEVYAAGAKGERRLEARELLFDKAIEAFKGYIDENTYSEYLPDAQKSYVDLVNAYAGTLERRLPELRGEEADALREKIKDVVGDAISLTADLIDLTSGARTQSEKNERYRLMLNRGQMLMTSANVSEDGTFFYAKAEQTLERLAGEAGETSGPGLNAFVILAKVKLAQGLAGEACDFAEFVVNVAIPADEGFKEETGWNDASFEERVPRWRLAELGCSVLVDALLESGRVPQAATWSLHYYSTWKSEGFDVSSLGHVSLLACARALLESEGYVGGSLTRGDLQWFATEDEMKSAGFQGVRNSRSALDLALSIAQTVNEENQGSTLQVSAQTLISSIVDRPGVKVSPDILFEAAQGEYNARNYADAITAFKGILRRLEGEDEASQQEYAPKVLYYIGRSLSALDRDLEAAMAFREAATTWAGDPEYQEKVADGYYRSIGQAKKSAPSDQTLQNLYLEAENLVVNAASSDDGSITFRQAERAYGEKDYIGARNLYLQVAEGAELYEKAMVRAALCLYKTKDYANAEAEFMRYLDVYVKDPRTKPVDARRKETRQQAMAMATFYLGRRGYDAGDIDVVLRWLGDYQVKFPGQDDYGPNALYMVVKAHLAKRDVGSAKETITAMKDVYGLHSRTGAAAIQVFSALKAEEERATQAGDEGRLAEIRLQMVEYIGLANESAETPSYKNLRAESALWIELGRWSEAEEVLRSIVSAFESSSSAEVAAHVLPDLGLALLEQKRVPEAFDVLDPLVPRDEAGKPSSKLISRWCRSVTGWLEGDADAIVEVPGVGGADNLELAASYLRKLTEAEGRDAKYTGAWYQLKFETAYAYYQWGQVDSTQTNNAKVLIENLQNILGQSRLDDVAEKTGDRVLQSRFLWLEGKLR